MNKAFLEVPGWLSLAEGQELSRLAARRDVIGTVVEIGSFKGRSTLFLVAGAADAVHCVDTFLGSPEMQPAGQNPIPEMLRGESLYPAFRQNLCRFELEHHVIAHIGVSENVAVHWNYPIRLLFIDADHSEACLRGDIAGWVKHVPPGGVIAFHDYDDGNWPDVKTVVDEFLPLCASHYVVDHLMVCTR